VSSLEKCEEDLAEFQAQLAECQANVTALEAESTAEKASLRAEWQAVTAQVANISEQVGDKEAELDELEAANSALHAELIESLGSIGLLQMKRSDPEEETQRWLACEDEKTSAELSARQCSLTIQTTEARRASTRQHYAGLTAAAQQNVAMVESRLAIVERMIASAEARNERLTEQVAQVKALTGASFAAVRSSVSRGPSLANASAESAEDAEAAEAAAAQAAAEHRRGAQAEDPVAEAREKLKTIDAEIAAMKKEVETRADVRELAQRNMGSEVKVQNKVAGRLRKTKEKTMAAFKKAFELDLQLDQLEAMHDDAYLASRNATAAWEAAARAEHEAVAELQTLITQKHRYESMIRGAEDPARLERETPEWAKEEEEKKTHSYSAVVGALALWLLL